MTLTDNINKLRLTVICLLINLITAGFFLTIGLLTGPISEQFGVELTYTAKQFSWLTGSYFAGTIVTFFILDYLSVRTMLLIYGAVIIGAALLSVVNTSIFLLPLILAMIGFLSGISICTAGTVISQIWKGKHQQVALLSQDAAFNVGGVVFPFVTAYILGAGMHWGYSYIVAALTILLVVSLILVSSFEFAPPQPQEQEENARTVFNFKVVLGGVFLFLVVVAKYIIIVWLPTYAETQLGATPLESSELVARVFGVALIGSVVGAIIIAKVNLTLFVAAAVLIGLLSSWQFTKADELQSLMLMVSLFGLSLSVLWNGFIAYGVAGLKSPSHKHISYIVFCGGLAATVTPVLSGLFVESFGLVPIFDAVAVLYGAVFIGIVLHEIAGRLKPRVNNIPDKVEV